MNFPLGLIQCNFYLFFFLPLGEGEEEGGDKKEDGGEGDKKKRQTRGGKGLMKAKKKIEPTGVKLWTASRGKKKKVTIVVGLASYGEKIDTILLMRVRGRGERKGERD